MVLILIGTCCWCSSKVYAVVNGSRSCIIASVSFPDTFVAYIVATSKVYGSLLCPTLIDSTGRPGLSNGVGCKRL